ncbi:hypothetical protein KIW84_015788 [Lathyrus oleraceus]|uniref:Reverse transcriptase zinc-binding domain-containing protein n=1 Tax=Pisum sativum TaxID=3888 RepID=A0A9D5BRI7_PEA|nr:hypothetical protein KIW84_015788 [Pisum sativum]
MLMQVFVAFSDATGLKVNPSKCKFFFRNVSEDVNKSIQDTMKFTEGRTRLIKSVLFAFTNYWLQCLPLPKKVIRKIEAICRTFLWPGTDKITRKSPIAWKKTKNFQTRKMYDGLYGDMQEVSWRRMFYNAAARPRSLFNLWMACHRKLATKDRLVRFGFLNEDICCFSNEQETIDHLFFQCREIKNIWKSIMGWMGMDHIPGNWNEEVNWISELSKSKAGKVKILNCALAETIYETWKYMNDNCFKNDTNKSMIDDRIIDNVVYRFWSYLKLRKVLCTLMMP